MPAPEQPIAGVDGGGHTVRRTENIRGAARRDFHRITAISLARRPAGALFVSARQYASRPGARVFAGPAADRRHFSFPAR
ncbi:hypothetical protein Sme01_56990 [Sphaerisporangium melleum]|uniref:Uncharacterized protein n=1 Tax=Sphaerisporangium melleum TaxID=321316 RepID=A0A917R8A6_9ACTN|nr:hypothetical protein [Sphaerisporangium melleum]GGK94264.1 hypothetical protein GCM10007964_40870 [Sphaerisporangium melleum]GII73223.1 hypothetical protein Sme01_56990 [Sphaerisporangium melleum]